MPDISFLLNHLGCKVIRRKIVYTDLPDMEGIILLNKQDLLPPGYLFIANGEELCIIMSRINPSFPITILTSGDYGHISDYENMKSVNLIATSLDIFDLYNDINSFIKSYQDWTVSFMKAVCEGKDLKYVISHGGAMLKVPVFLLNACYGVICSNTDYLINDVYIDEMLTNGSLSVDSVEKLFGMKAHQTNDQPAQMALLSKITQNTYNIETVKYKDSNIAFLMIVTNSTHSTIDVAYFTSKMADCIKGLLLRENIESLSTNTGFSSFIGDVIELRLTETEEIENRLKLVNHPLNVFCSCIVIQFSEEDARQLPYSCIISQLEQIMPGNNITVYDGDIVILFSYKDRTWHFELDYERLETLLNSYNAFAGMSNGTRHRDKIRTMYLLAKSTVRLGKVLRRDKSKRIFTHEEYSMYCIIDLCAKNFYEKYKHGDIVYLSHPAVVALTRYDHKYNNNLREILFHYLINDRNLIKTSKVLYMHRNTLLNKINKITEIVGESLDNGRLQLRLLFSCLLLRYYEDYMKSNIPYDKV